MPPIFFSREETDQNFPLPDALQSFRVHWRKIDKRAVRMISSIGHSHMNMRLEIDEIAERLNTGDRAGKNVVPSDHFHERLPCRAVEPAQEPSIQPEKDAR